MENRRVVITGLGVIAPNGIGKNEFWQALKHGKSGINKITRFDASSYPCQIAGEVQNFDPTDYMDPKTAKKMDRFSHFAVACARMAIKDAGITMKHRYLESSGIVVGSAIGGVPMAESQHAIFLEKGIKRISPYLAISLFTGAASSQISIALGIRGYSNTIGGACAAGTDAIGYAFEIIRDGQIDMVITGGAEAPLAPLTFGAFCVIDALSSINGDPARASRPFDAERDGFVMSEGAGIIVLEELGHAVRREAHIYAEIIGYGTTYDSYHMVQPLPDAKQAAKAVAMTLRDAGIGPDEIDYINAHGTSTPLNDKTETMAVKEVFGESAYKVPISATKSMTGHSLGAAGAMEVIVSAMSMEDNYIHPTINYEFPDPACDLDYVPNTGRAADIHCVLTNSYGFGGKNSCLILRKFED